jgi:hypothetical protein
LQSTIAKMAETAKKLEPEAEGLLFEKVDRMI